MVETRQNTMNIQIELLDPKAKRLLEDLAALGIIRIKENSSKDKFTALLDQFRSQESVPPTPEEIASEVEQVRKERYQSKREQKISL